VQIGDKSFGTLERFKYLGTTLTNQNSIHEEIKSRLKPGNACCHSVQNLLSSSLLSKSVKIKIYRAIILRVVLYGCGTWSLTLRKECRLRAFENTVLRRTFGPKRDDVTGKWRRLHNKKLDALYPSQNIIRRGAYKVLVGKPEGRISLGRPRRRWEDNIKTNVLKVGWGHGLDRSC
jgi:hypothetical protein